uniref:G-protein coupled receptors family 1 profile domain-containing protein n=1 Tax=Romanomermis culicivorax TaxID=13658 RepID=A0A915JBX0_ROMCU
MLVAILSIFVVTELPQAMLTTASGLFTHDLHFHVYPLVGDMLDLLSLLNSCVNFVLYCAMSSRYRMAFERTVRPLKTYLQSKIRNGDVISVYRVRCGNSPTRRSSAASFFPDNVSLANVIVMNTRLASPFKRSTRLSDYQEKAGKNSTLNVPRRCKDM